jgi:hypothetical protein
MADSEEKLQSMLDTVSNWCQRWRGIINADKSKCMHCRKGRAQRSVFEFKIGSSTLEIVEKYKCLGVIFNEKNYFYLNSESLGKAAGRALGGKIHSLKDFGFKSYEKLYLSCVVPILDYCSSVWGFKKYQATDNVLGTFLVSIASRLFSRWLVALGRYLVFTDDVEIFCDCGIDSY